MNNIDLSGKIGSRKFHSVFLNASGIHCRTYKDLNNLMGNKYIGGVITKSSTLKPHQGNQPPRYHELPNGSINAMGLPNRGLDYYLKYVSKHHSKPTILSIAGITPLEDVKMLKEIQNSRYEGLVELNLSCPNIAGHAQMAYDAKSMAILLGQIYSFYQKPLGIKLPPYLDLIDLDQSAMVLNQFPLSYVNVINSVGNGLWVNIQNETTVIRPRGGFGGLGGHMILPIALANVRAFRQRLKPSIKIIGTGGIKTGADVFAHILCGADIVSIGTQLQVEGLTLYKRLTKELKRIMKKKGYASLSDFRGTLKVV